MLRAAYSLGGKGSGIVDDPVQLEDALRRAFSAGITQKRGKLVGLYATNNLKYP